MRATGGTLQFRRSNSSRRICQMRPTTKPNASEAKIWSTVTSTTLIGLPFLAKAHTLWHRIVTHFLPATRAEARKWRLERYPMRREGEEDWSETASR